MLDKKFIHCDGDSEQSMRVRFKRWWKEISPSILLIPNSDPWKATPVIVSAQQCVAEAVARRTWVFCRLTVSTLSRWIWPTLDQGRTRNKFNNLQMYPISIAACSTLVYCSNQSVAKLEDRYQILTAWNLSSPSWSISETDDMKIKWTCGWTMYTWIHDWNCTNLECTDTAPPSKRFQEECQWLKYAFDKYN